MSNRGTSFLVAIACGIFAFFWQSLTVHYNYHGNWTALFCTGELLPIPPQLAGEHIYIFRGSYGYDGEYYHYIAHDPFLQHGITRYIDSPRYRYRRVLISWAAFALALGRSDRVDAAYYSVVLAIIMCGAYWLSLYSAGVGRSAAWGLEFLALPATLVSIDRMTVDVALAALCVGFVLFAARGSRAALCAVLVAAPFVREMGFFLAGAYVLHLVLKREIRQAALWSTTVIPGLAWYLWVHLHTPPYPTGLVSIVPFQGLVGRLLAPPHYPLAPAVAALATGLDYAGLAGIVVAVALAARRALARRTGPMDFAIYLFALIAIFVSAPEAWADAYAFARGLTPLALLEAMDGMKERRWIAALPLALLIPRVALQLGPQALGILTSWR